MLALALALGASCGDDDEQSTATTASTASTASTSPTQTTVSSRVQRCDQVAFTPDSEDTASDIEATGLTCEEAERLVRAAGPRTSSGGPQSVTVDGFRCVLTGTEEDPLPRASFECTDGNRKVTFVRT